jgi:mono/diheme cytochrome c family protein
MKRTRATHGFLGLVLILPWGFASTTAADDAKAGAAVEPYVVECGAEGPCQVDKATYIGWRTYHANCHVCHAQDAVGSSFAPGLVDKLQEIDKERFMTAVSEGYTGQIGVMPAWKDNPNVNKRFDDLYAYLKARSDGVLPPGKPKRMKKK